MASSIQLRPVTEEDLPILYLHQLDPEARQMAAFPGRDWHAFLLHWRNNILGNDVVIKRTILLEGEVAGNIGSWEHDGIWEIGYWIGKEYWGRGIASKAVMDFLPLVQYRPLFAHVVRHNKASLRVLEKNGFQIVGKIFNPESETCQQVEEFQLRLDAQESPGQ